jgi:hypothetical protein
MLIASLLLAATLDTPIPLDRARNAFAEAKLASDEDAGKMWGRALYGPMIFVDPKTRFAVANQPDGNGALKADNGVFTGTLPDSLTIANTATKWNGIKWTMVLWPALGERATSQRALLLHECWHRVQDDLGFPATQGDNAHLDSLDGRVWFLLELRALAKALRNEDRPAAINDALLFRAKRRALFPAAAKNEHDLEANEALAEYTGFALRGTPDSESRIIFARRLDNVDRNTSFVRGFAYLTGPAYGLLLDAIAPGWTRTLKVSDDLSDVLSKAFKVTPTGDADARALAYDGAALRTLEEKRDRENRERVAAYRALLVDGPVIELPMANANYGFDPNAVVPLGDAGNVHPNLSVSADWGVISTDRGARIASDFSMFIFSAADRDKLKLNDGWEIVAGSRAGDWRVRRKAPPS